MHEFQQLEDATIAALEPLKAQGLKTLAPYSGELQAENIIAITRLFPCVYVFAAGLVLNKEGKNSKLEIELQLFVGDRNVRGSAQAGKGVYELLVEIRKKLHGQKILQNWSPFVLTAEMPLVYFPKQSVCLYVANYKTMSMTRF